MHQGREHPAQRIVTVSDVPRIERATDPAHVWVPPLVASSCCLLPVALVVVPLRLRDGESSLRNLTPDSTPSLHESQVPSRLSGVHATLRLPVIHALPGDPPTDRVIMMLDAALDQTPPPV